MRRRLPLPSLAACTIALSLGAALAGCARAPQHESVVRHATITLDAVPTYEAELDLHFSRAMTGALDRGIPLKLLVHVAAHDRHVAFSETHALQLRYLPLARRYQLRDLGTGAVRTFARRSQLVASLDRLRLPLAPEWAQARGELAYSTRVALDKTALPGPLRLPALFLPEWRTVDASYTWRARH